MNINFEKIYDVSMPIHHAMPVYKGKEAKRPELVNESNFKTGTVYESKIMMNVHTGTHLDRTLHMMSEGNTIETVNLSELIVSCKVLDLSLVKEKITKEDLITKRIEAGDFLLLKTRNSIENILETEFVYLERTGAQYLAERNIKGVGIDALGIERNQPEHETHLTLMNKDIHILEGLRLEQVEEGEYLMLALPINIVGAEAAPVRVVLLQ